MEDSEKKEQISRLEGAYRVGLGLLWQDRFWAIAMLCLTSALPILSYLRSDTQELPGGYILSMALIDCLAVYLISVSCLRHLGKASLPFISLWGLANIGFGMGLWIIMNGPTVVVQSMPAENLSAPLRLSLLVIVLISIYFNLRFAFYHFTLAAGFRNSLTEAIKLSANLTKANIFLPVRVVIGPMALMVLLTGIISALAPDGSSLEIDLLSTLLRRAILLPIAYLSCAFASLLLTDSAWRELGLDPYRSSRLSTLAFRGSPGLAKLFQPKQALIIVLLGAMVWLGNGLRNFETPPKPSISIIATAAGDNSAQIKLHLADSEFKFRGFNPNWFLIRGAEGTKISSSPTNVNFHISPDRTSAELSLDFSTEKSAVEIAKLKDLYLWYMNAKLIPLSFTSPQG